MQKETTAIESQHHPMGEDLKMAFSVYGGQIFLESSSDSMTPFGGFVPWAAYQKKIGIFEKLTSNCPLQRSSPNASKVYDILCSFALTTLCDGTRFSHVNRLRQDPTIAELFGMKKVVSDDTIRRFFASFDLDEASQWVDQSTQDIWKVLPERFIQDWDSTVQTRYGSQEGAEVGYNPMKRGRPSHHPLFAIIGGSRLCSYYGLRSGKSASSTGVIEAIEESYRWLGRYPWLNRADIGFANNKVMSWHEQSAQRPDYLFKLKLTGNVKKAIQLIPQEQWKGKPGEGMLQLAEVHLQLSGWDCPRRVVLGRRHQGMSAASMNGEFWDVIKYEYEAYVTSINVSEAESWQIVDLYRKRADCENVFDELKNQWGFNGFCSQKKVVTALSAKLLLLMYNLWNLFLRVMEPSRHIEAKNGRRWFLFIAARLTKTSRKREWKIAVQGSWLEYLKDGYNRILQWLNSTAPQLKNIPILVPEIQCLRC